jgi:hypothetical protein
MDGVRNRPARWGNLSDLPAKEYVCAYCGNQISSIKGFAAANHGNIYICHHCSFPTFFGLGPDGATPMRIPADLPGKPVTGMPGDVGWLYEEARRCAAAGAYTASVLVCRKMLINMAVNRGDEWKKGKPFTEYVEFLAGTLFAPDYTATWLDRIREKGNTTTHELGAMTREDSLLLIEFIEMLLKVMFEYPNAAGTAAPVSTTS